MIIDIWIANQTMLVLVSGYIIGAVLYSMYIFRGGVADFVSRYEKQTGETWQTMHTVVCVFIVLIWPIIFPIGVIRAMLKGN